MGAAAQWSAATIGAVLFVVALALMRRRAARRAVIILMVLAGACLGGAISGVMNWILDTLADLAGPVTQIAFGVVAPIAIMVGVVVLMVLDFMRRQPRRWTPWAGLLLIPAIGFFVPSVPPMVQGAVGSVANQAVGLWGQATGSTLDAGGR